MNRSGGGSPQRKASEPVWLQFPNPMLESGLIVGHVTECSARIWIRCGMEHRLIVRQRRGLIRDLPIHIRPDADHTVVIDLEDLRPATTYELDLVGPNGQSVLPTDIEARVRTQPDLSTWTRTCFGIVSCNMPYESSRHGTARLKANVAMLGELRFALEREGADFVISMGDQVYADGPPALDIWKHARARLRPDDLEGCRALFHQLYRGYWGLDELRKIHGRFPQYMIWDDHEVVDDWGSHPCPKGLSTVLWSTMETAGRGAYGVYQHAHNPPTPPGTHHYWFDHGPVAFFVMDLRGQRSAPHRRLLGAQQWRDLEDWLRRTQSRPARFLISSVPLVHVPDRLVSVATRLPDRPGRRLRLPDALYDRWCSHAFHPELERLMSRLLRQPDAVAPVTVLSGDIHIAAAFEFTDDRRLPARVQQWITSGITSESRTTELIASQLLGRVTNLATRWRMARHFDARRNNFGIVEVNKTKSARYETAFHLYVWDGARARKVHTVRCGARDRMGAVESFAL